MSNRGNVFKKAIVDYIRSWANDKGLPIKIGTEKIVGYRFVGQYRKVDILLYYNGNFLGIEAKLQETPGTAYQKLIYTLEDCKKAPIPMIIVFSGDAIKEDVKSMLITSGYGIEVGFDGEKVYEDKPILLQRVAIELGIDWFDII